MPVGFSSPSRNLFLLGSSGEQVVTNFFKTIDKSAGTDGVYLPDEIKYNFVDQKFLLAGSASDSNSKGFGWFEKRDQDGIADWDVRVEATTSANTTLRAMELDANDNLIVVGKTADIPWIAKYSNGGVIDWQSTTNSGDVEYTGITSDANGNYYACGNTPVAGEAQAFVEKFDSSGTPGWGKSAFMLGRDVVLNRIAANSRGEVVAVGYLEDDIYNKGYIIKIDTNTGEVLWDRTLQPDWQGDMLNCTDVYIDSNDQIYVTVNGFSVGYLLKYTAEGNMIWQKVSNDSAASTITFDQVKSDGETEQTIVFGTYTDPTFNDTTGILSKYSKDGSLVWRRTVYSNYSSPALFSNVNLDADASFYYLLYIDDTIDGLTGTPQKYTFGKVSSSGNGLGAFQYTEGTGVPIDYNVLNITDTTGRLSDGSVRQDTSDLITYPFSANKLLFDDLATQVSNKKRQMDTADSFEYSGSPAIRPADFQELNLLGDVYSGSGNWLDQSGKGNDGTTLFVGPFPGSGSLNFLGGSTDRLEIANSADFNFGTGAYTIEMFIKTTAAAGWLYHENDPNNSGMRLCVGTNGSIGSNDGRIEFNEQSSNNDNFVQGSTQINDGQWHHIAVVRGASGDATKLYVDGVLDATGSANRNFDSSDTLYIGARGTYGGNEYAGEISNLRVVKGVQVYTGNFTPPSAPLTDLSGTSLLVDGSSITDISSNARTITTVGGITAKNPSPTHNAAGYWEFDGVDDTINLGSTPIISSGSFTYEAWGWVDAFALASGDECSLINYEGTNQSTLLLSAGSNFDGGVGHRFVVRKGNSNEISIRGNIAANGFNEWHHYVGVYNDDTQTAVAYVDGVQVNTGTNINVSGWTAGTTSRQDLGVSAGGTRFLDGRIGEVRIYPRALTAAQVFQNYNATKSKYINEAPDTAPKIGPGIVYDSNLLLNYDFGNRATYDRAENLLESSEEFDSNYWIIQECIVEDVPDELSPVGLKGVKKVSVNAVGPTSVRLKNFTTVEGGFTYTASVYVKDAGAPAVTLFNDGTNSDPNYAGAGSYYNLSGPNAGQVSGSSADSAGMEYVGNGWWRCWFTDQYDSGGSWHPLTIVPQHTGAFVGVNSQTNANGKGCYIWGAQLEKGSTPGRYIKTSGTAITAPTTVKNLSSTSYPSTISGAEFNSAGYFVFDNANNDEIITSQTTVADTGMPGLTVEVWANLSSSTVFGTGGNAWLFGEEGRYRLNYTSTSINWVCATANNGWYTTGTSITPSGLTILDGWHHIVGVYDGTNIRLDLDGTTQLTSTSAISGNVLSSGDPLMSLMGTDAANVGWGTGNIGQVRIYNRGLTATEVSQNFNATRSKYGV